MQKLFIDSDIRKASTLSSSFYSSESFFQLSKQKIFEKTWQFSADTDHIHTSNHLLPITVLPGFLDEPILFTRNKNDKINCVSNVCTHRGNILVENACSDMQIRCKYHGRRFDHDGCFKYMPEFENVENFPSEKDNLTKVPFSSWGKFLFSSIHPFAPLNDFISEMKNRLSFLPLNEFKIAPLRSRDYLVKAHWALYCENYLEGFHIPFIHQGLNNVIDYASYSTELYKYSNLQLALSKGGEDVFNFPLNHQDYGKQISAFYYWVFPNMMFNFYPWGLSLNIIRPLTPTLTKVSFITYVYDENKLERGAGAMLDKVEREDEAVVENVQKGINSKFYQGGRYSPKRETGTHHFHRLIAEFMNA